MTATPNYSSSDPAKGWWSQLDYLDPDWKLLACNGKKQPIDPHTGHLLPVWGSKCISIQDFKLLPRIHIQAVGLGLGPVSGGTLTVDFDGEGSEEIFALAFGKQVSELPESVSWKSGRPGRRQVAFKVDEKHWEQLRGKKSWKNQNNDNCLELRWRGQQSIILGAHPETSGYQWCDGCSPRELSVTEAPEWLLKPLIRQQAATPVFSKEIVDEEESRRAIHLLKHVLPRDDYDDWLKVGMALHSVDVSLLDEWITWSQGSSFFDEKECIDKWESFKGSGVTLGTLYHMAKLDSNNQVDFKWSCPEIGTSSNEANDANDDLSIEDSLKGLIELYAQSKIEAQALLPEYLKDAMSIILKTVKYEWSVLLLVLIVGISGALPLESNIELIPGDFDQSLNLFAVLLMDTGEAKSPLIKRIVTSPWKKSVDVIMKQRYSEALKYWKQLKEDSANTNGDLEIPKPDPVQTLITEDLTPQGVERHLVLHERYAKGSILLLFDEGKDLLAEMAGQNVSTNQLKLGTWVLSRYDGTGGRGAKADATKERHYSQCRVSALISCQPDIYRQITGDADQSGLAGRFVAVEQSTVEQLFPEEFDLTHQQKHNELADLLVALYTYVCDRSCVSLKLSDEALKMFQRERQFLDDRKNQSLSDAERGQLNKAHGRLGRLAGNLHLMWSFDPVMPNRRELPQVVDVDSMQRAIQLNRFLLSQSVLVRQTSTGNNLSMQKILAFHSKAHKVNKASKVSEIRKALHSPMRTSKEETELIVNALHQIGVGRSWKDERGTRWYQSLKPLG